MCRPPASLLHTLAAGLAINATSQHAQVCLFSYGQTGAGKTHTMQGSTGPQEGIIPRAMHKVQTVTHATPRELPIEQPARTLVTGLQPTCHGLVAQILEAVDGLQQQGWEYRLEASYVEVYNETLRDLLAAGNTKRDGAKLLDASAIKHDAAGRASGAALASMPRVAFTSC